MRRRLLRGWFFDRWVALVVGVIVLVYLAASDTGRLHASVLWGRSDCLPPAVAGLAVGLAGVIPLASAVVSRLRGHAWVERPGWRFRLWLGSGYAIGMTLVFFAAHPHPFGQQSSADSPIMFAALVAQVLLAGALAVILTATMTVTAFRRTES
jgi:hypothetical protein